MVETSKSVGGWCMKKRKACRIMCVIASLLTISLMSLYFEINNGIFTDSRIFSIIPLWILVAWMMANRKAIRIEAGSRIDAVLYNPWLATMPIIIFTAWIITITT